MGFRNMTSDTFVTVEVNITSWGSQGGDSSCKNLENKCVRYRYSHFIKIEIWNFLYTAFLALKNVKYTPAEVRQKFLGTSCVVMPSPDSINLISDTLIMSPSTLYMN